MTDLRLKIMTVYITKITLPQNNQFELYFQPVKVTPVI